METSEISISIVFIVAIIIIMTIMILFVLLSYRTFVLRIIKEKNEQHLLELQYQKQLLEHTVIIQESERERIAVKLHDDIGI